ncbi:MAG: hypothetical protein ACOYXT_01595 [Bacteroidota bacterium]
MKLIATTVIFLMSSIGLPKAFGRAPGIGFTHLPSMVNSYGSKAFAIHHIGQDQPITVIVFIGIDCPISQKYIGALNDIQSRYRNQVRITGYVPQQVSEGEIKTFISEYQVTFDLRKDPRKKIARRVEAKVTPEVFVYRHPGPFSKDNLIYRGAIDNWFYELGKYRQAPTENFLIDVLDAVIRGESVRIKETEALGCPIPLSKKKRVNSQY